MWRQVAGQTQARPSHLGARETLPLFLLAVRCQLYGGEVAEGTCGIMPLRESVAAVPDVWHVLQAARLTGYAHEVLSPGTGMRGVRGELQNWA